MRTKTDRLFTRYRETGDPLVLAKVFDLVAPRLLVIARHLVPDVALAEDVVQETLVAAIEGAQRFDPRRPVLPWLMGILARQAGLLRRSRREPDPARLTERDVVEPSAEVLQNELEQAVDRALARIPAPYDRVLAIHLKDGKRPEEIAGELGRLPATVRVQLHRGLKLLRRALPAGLTAGAAVTIAPRGLAAVKSEVLRQAAASAGSPLAGGAAFAGGTVAATTTGALVMAQNLILAGVAAALVVTAAGWYVLKEPAPEATSLATGGGAERVGSGVSNAQLRPVDTSAAGVLRDPTDTADGSRTVVERDSRRPPASPQVEAAQASSETWTLSGRVVEKDVLTPVPGATLLAFTGSAEEGYDRHEAASASAGSFRFEVPEQPLSLIVSAAGFASTLVSAQTLGTERDVDLGTLELERGMRVAGRVVDARGEPVAEARLFQFMAPTPGVETDSGGIAWQVATTDADGEFELAERLNFTGASMRDYGLCAMAQAGVGWQTFALLEGAGDMKRVELELQAGTGLHVDVRDEQGRAVPAARVHVWPRWRPLGHLHGADDPRWGGSSSPVSARFVRETGDGGRASFEGLPLGSPDEPASRLYRVEARDVDGDVLARDEVVLDPLRPTVCVLVPEPGAVVVVEGFARLADGLPVPGLALAIGAAATESDGDGHYRLEVRRPDEGELLLACEGAGLASNRYAVPVPADATQVVFDVTVAPARVVAGVVVDQRGTPVPGCYTNLFRASDTPSTRGSRTTLSDAKGRFRFDDAAPGRWQLNVSPPFRDDGFAGMQILQVEGGDDALEVVLERIEPGEARVVARVVDARSGSPVDPTAVHLSGRGSHEPGRFPVHHDMQRRSGGVAAEGVRVGAWRIWAVAEGYVPCHADFEVLPGQRELEVTIELGTSGGLRGRVQGAPQLVGRVAVQLDPIQGVPSYGPWSTTANYAASGEIAADGSFAFDALLPGVYSVRSTCGAWMGDREVRVPASGKADLVIDLEPAGSVVVVGDEPDEGGWIRIELVHLERDWRSDLRYAKREDGRFSAGIQSPVGRVRWSVSFRPENVSNTEPLRTAEGEVVITGGRPLEVRADLR